MVSVRDVTPNDKDFYIAVKKEQYSDGLLKLLKEDDAMFVGLWEDVCADNHRLFAIEDEESGICGFGLLQDLDSGKPSIGIDIFKKQWGKGIATEGVRLILQQYHNETGVSEFLWRAFASNTGSNRVAEKLGGVFISEERLEIAPDMTARLAKNNVDLAELLPRVKTYQIRI